MHSLYNNAEGTKCGSDLLAGKLGWALHFIGICGKAMGGIAADLARNGWRVSGSDEDMYAPMSDHLQRCGIRILTPYDSANVPANANLVIVGKRIAADNPELLHVIRHGIPHSSFPQFLREHFLCRSRNVVVTGGVGKTTTTAMLAWILEHNGLNPDYLIGGSARNFPAPARFSGSPHAVLEGDEYASSFDDRNPKFSHYHPEVAIITNIIEDHPDLYHSFEDLRDVFLALVEMLPAHGRLIVADDDETAEALAAGAKCEVITAGFGSSASQRITGSRLSENVSHFRLMNTEFEIPLCGLMNIRNAAMAALAAAHFGIAPEQSARSLKLFQGVRNRQDEMEIRGCTLVRDKASHPRAIVELAAALRQRFPGRRLVSVIQPRATGGRSWIYQRDLPDALSRFDKVILLSACEHRPQQPQPWQQSPFCIDLLASGLHASSVEVVAAPNVAGIPDIVCSHVRDGDVLVATLLEQSSALVDLIEAALATRKTTDMDEGTQSRESVVPAA